MTKKTTNSAQTTAARKGAAAGARADDRSNTAGSGTANQNNNSEGDDPNEGLHKLFKHQLADLYYVEKQLVKHLPEMIEKARNKQLVRALEDHLEETEEHVARLERIFRKIGEPAKGEQCPAYDGIIKEAKDLMKEFDGDPALDAALVCAAQKVEHYEITSYGSLCAFAEQLDMHKVCDLLEATLDEEKDADAGLSRLAEQVLNVRADVYEETTTTTSRGRAEHRTVDDMVNDARNSAGGDDEEENAPARTGKVGATRKAVGTENLHPT